jgi:hypothetical protein
MSNCSHEPCPWKERLIYFLPISSHDKVQDPDSRARRRVVLNFIGIDPLVLYPGFVNTLVNAN